ncbi:uncharacterized protein [Dermacentor albipictus]|uniref:uncharacterized protein isoform X1 n=1 Tax=Dermacentor albipictus TaxID=60249 RepID=UPI0038FC71DF
MERPQVSNAFLDDDFFMELMNSEVEDVSALARRLVAFGTEASVSSQLLPVHCTDSQTRTCHLLKQLSALNELLYYIGADLTEVGPGKIAVRCYTSFNNDEQIKRDPHMVTAIIFLHCIVTRHRCVDILQLRLQPREQRNLDSLMCNTMKRISLLSSFCLSDSDLTNTTITAAVFSAVTHLLRSRLTELSLEHMRLTNLCKEACAPLYAFMTALSETSALKWLRVFNTLFPNEVFDFVGKLLQALEKSTDISCLILDASFSSHRCGSSFKRMLARPTAPPDVTVICHNHTYRTKANIVFGALITNKTVTKLTIEGFKLGVQDSKSISKFLATNNTIQEMALVSVEWDLRKQKTQKIRWHADHLAGGLRQAKSLRRLALGSDFSVAEIRCIIEATQVCESLKELHFSVILEDDVEPISAARQEMTNNWKITIGQFWISVHLNAAKQIACCHEVLSSPDRVEPLNLIFAPLGHSCGPPNVPCGDHLTFLLLGGTYFTKVPPDVAKGLGLYLALTRSLRKLGMEFETSHDSAQTIIEGIAKNKSIEQLRIERFSVKDDDWATLSNWLIDNRRLHNLDISPPRENAAVVKSWATSFESNYSVTAMKIFDRDLTQAAWMRIKNITRRNCGLVHCAAAFVMGSSLKRAAVAYELVSWHPQLPEVVEYMGSLSESEAKARVEQSRLRLRDEFWQLSGIVKGQLICNAPPTGANGKKVRQLDKLGADMLDYLRSYLKVGDILDDEEEDPKSENAAAAMERSNKRKRANSTDFLQQEQ